MHDDLGTALLHHRQGQLDQAARHYQAILAGSPDHPDALHLLGVVAHQLSAHARAVVLIGEAIARRPDVSAYHANLAEAHRALGQLDQAAASCRTALLLSPDSPEADNTLGVVLLAQNQPEEAAAQFRRALGVRPTFALAASNLGNALRLVGDSEQALVQFRAAVRLDPGLGEAHSNLGQLLLERKQLEEALVHCREAIRLRPDLAAGHSNLGNVLREMNRLEEARASYAEALRLAPGIGMVHNNMAQALQEEGRLDEARPWYERALQLEPQSPRIHSNLASLLAEQEKHDESAACYELALRLDPVYAEAHNGLGWVRHEQGRLDEAQALYRRAIQHKPGLAAAHCNLGSVLEELGDLDGAQWCFREALGHDARLPGALAQLAALLRKALPDADREAMQHLLDDPYLSEGQRGCLHFGLAQALDARKEYVQAAMHLARANAISVAEWRKRGQSYDPAEHTRFVDRLIATFTPEFFERSRGLGLESEQPVFIVGLPRSGTTLTEQVMASHSQVFGAGELRLGRESFERLGAQPLDQVARRHLEELRALASRERQRPEFERVVDKMPDNYLHLGLLAVLFPRAKFIHCRRDLRDVAVSCWMTNFRHIRWASDPDHIATRFQDYRRLDGHWRQVLPVEVLEVEYEETVADLEGVARRLVAFCGLEWEPACLAFHQSKRPVRTASVSQVRQPVYTGSVARWKHYEQALGALFARLA
jgi:tetratricopeptide (TPR) repeat protein